MKETFHYIPSEAAWEFRLPLPFLLALSRVQIGDNTEAVVMVATPDREHVIWGPGEQHVGCIGVFLRLLGFIDPQPEAPTDFVEPPDGPTPQQLDALEKFLADEEHIARRLASALDQLASQPATHRSARVDHTSDDFRIGDVEVDADGPDGDPMVVVTFGESVPESEAFVGTPCGAYFHRGTLVSVSPLINGEPTEDDGFDAIATDHERAARRNVLAWLREKRAGSRE